MDRDRFNKAPIIKSPTGDDRPRLWFSDAGPSTKPYLKFTRNGKDIVVSEVHLGEKYDGPLPFKLHEGGSNDFSVKKILGPPSKKQKAKDGGPIWEKMLDRERGVVYQRSRGHFDWFAEHRFFVQR